MSLANGIPYLAIPGPSVTPEAVKRAMLRSSPNIYTGELIDMVPPLLRDLAAVAKTAGDVVPYICNGHGAWEAALVNTVAPGEVILMIHTGAFADGWADMARALGIEVEVMAFDRRTGVEIERVSDRLAAMDAKAFKAVCVVHVDTATSIRTDVAEIRTAMDDAGSDALLLLDCIASLGCDDVAMDDWGVDLVLAGSQKGLMTPPGMAFLFLSARAREARGRLKSVSPYWDWQPRIEPDLFYRYFCGTAPTHHLYGLRAALDLIAEEGLDAIHRRHAVLASAVRRAVEHWGEGGPLELNVTREDRRSNAVTGVRAGSDKGTALRDWCETRAGLTLGIGLGMAPERSPEWHHFFRIGHMGHMNAHMVLGALATIEAGLTATGIAHRPGGVVAAAGIVAESA
jgi:alanine-glyoxylate transaminase/serine-glyoxylate transaminase/serine-pyruvate transaminase